MATDKGAGADGHREFWKVISTINRKKESRGHQMTFELSTEGRARKSCCVESMF